MVNDLALRCTLCPSCNSFSEIAASICDEHAADEGAKLMDSWESFQSVYNTIPEMFTILTTTHNILRAITAMIRL